MKRHTCGIVKRHTCGISTRNAGFNSGTVDVFCRVLGLTGVIQTDCSQVYALNFYPNVRWMLFVNPGILLLLYWVLAFETRYWFQTKVRLATGSRLR